METRVDLDIIGAIEGSDKSSSIRAGWDYLRNYEAQFEEFRTQPINLIEIGVARGPSLRAWQWFFSQARIIGIDINPDCAAYSGGRVKVEIGSQVDGPFIDRICTENPPTIIIDDGSHQADHIITTFERAFPFLLPGGLYIVEDLAFHFGQKSEKTGVARAADAPGYFAAIAQDCMARFGRGGIILTEAPHPFSSLIDSIMFIGSALIIRRRREGRDTARAVAVAETYLENRLDDAVAQTRLAEYILLHAGPLDRAAAAVARAQAVEGATPTLRVLQARVLMAQGLVPAAQAIMAALEHDTSLPPEQVQSLAKLFAQAGNLTVAVRLAKQAADAAPGAPSYQRLVERLQKRLKKAK